MKSEGDQTQAVKVGEGENVGSSEPQSQSMTESESTTSHVFLNAQFEVPNPPGSGDESTTVVKHHFDGKNHKPARIGLKGEPIKVKMTHVSRHMLHFTLSINYFRLMHFFLSQKPQPGEYTYSGMHDHGPLPKPKEGGVFASLIGLCQEAKKSSDKYLTEVIEKEKQSQP